MTPSRVGPSQVSESPPSGPVRLSRAAMIWAWVRRSWVPLVLILASLTMVGTVTASHDKAFGPFDEWVYYDYVTKIPTQLVVREGEDIGKPALKAMSCDGDTSGVHGDPCGGPYNNLSKYPMQGKTSADLYTPAYFAVTWAAAKGIQFISGVDLLTAARLTGALWLAAAMWLFSSVMSRFRVRKIVTLAIGLAYIGSPIASWTYTFVGTDAPSFLLGAIMLLLAVRFVRGEISGWWLVPVGVVGVWFKITNLDAVGLILLFLIIYAIVRWKTPERLPPGLTRQRMLLTAVAMSVAAVAAEVVWVVIRATLKVGPQPDQGLSEPLSLHSIGANVTVFLPGPFAFTGGPLPFPSFLAAPLGWLVIAGVVASVFIARRWGVNRSLGIAVAVAVTAFAPILFVGTTLVTGNALPISPRYGAPLVAPMLLSVAYIMRNGLSRWLVLAYGAGLYLVTVGYAVKIIILNSP